VHSLSIAQFANGALTEKTTFTGITADAADAAFCVETCEKKKTVECTGRLETQTTSVVSSADEIKIFFHVGKFSLKNANLRLKYPHFWKI